jgi:hypothetical protein
MKCLVFQNRIWQRNKNYSYTEFLEKIKKQIKDMDRFKMHDVAKQVLQMDEKDIFRVFAPTSRS